MCRIAGIISASVHEHDFKSKLSLMLDSMARGGPDDEGTFIEGNVALGHRRLSIIDLSSAGHQPMLTQNSDLVISFNGEIYNYLILKNELEELGVFFQTKTDTEVILYAYRQWGTKAFDKFQGIFAFSLYDKKNKKIFLVRDHLGVKPLYYFLDNGKLIFASEVRAFKALQNDWPENDDWKILFLAFGSLPHPVTTLANVYQLSPGSFLELKLENFTCQIHQYYEQRLPEQHIITDPEKALVLIRESIREALQKNLLSDAPLGIFLSGGIDSSLLTLLADRIQENVKTISVNFEDASYDERPYQKMVLERTKHVKHVSYMLTEKMFWDQLEDVWQAMDQPSIDGVNSYFVSACAKNEGLKVVLSGLGADEYFGGYESVNRISWIKRLRLIPFKKLIAKAIGYRINTFKRLMFLNIPGAIGDYLFLRGIHTPDSIASLLSVSEERVWLALRKVKLEVPVMKDDKDYASYLESKIYMTNQLLKDTDYMSMWHGLEVRVPFLDIELLKKAQQIEPSLRYKRGWPKYLITASNRDILPPEIIFRKKSGFTFPFSVWIRNSPEKFRSMLPEGHEVNKVIDDFEKGRSHWAKCWSLAVIKQFN